MPKPDYELPERAELRRHVHLLVIKSPVRANRIRALHADAEQESDKISLVGVPPEKAV